MPRKPDLVPARLGQVKLPAILTPFDTLVSLSEIGAEGADAD